MTSLFAVGRKCDACGLFETDMLPVSVVEGEGLHRASLVPQA